MQNLLFNFFYLQMWHMVMKQEAIIGGGVQSKYGKGIQLWDEHVLFEYYTKG